MSEGHARGNTGEKNELGQEHNDRPSALRELQDTIRDKNKMSHKRKPNLHKVRKCPYMCVVLTDRARVAFVCQQVNFTSTRGLTFPATNPALRRIRMQTKVTLS